MKKKCIAYEEVSDSILSILIEYAHSIYKAEFDFFPESHLYPAGLRFALNALDVSPAIFSDVMDFLDFLGTEVQMDEELFKKNFELYLLT